MSAVFTSLQNFHTFHLPVSAREIIIVDSVHQLLQFWQQANQAQKPCLLLGEGSNVLFLEDFTGVVFVNKIKGIEIKEADDAWLLHVGAGENWHELVCFTLQQGMHGLENLALIPGCAGSAPIQNIGAYGVEFQHICAYVDFTELATGKMQRLSASECGFGYRDSVFKHQYAEGFAITHVGLRLPKQWQAVVNYGELRQLQGSATAQKVFDSVCAMRLSKLPDPRQMGNAGSFFKNPLVEQVVLQRILEKFPSAPHYMSQDGKIKLAAGWLIEQSGLKGHEIGGAKVHQHQALVLVNSNNATSQDVVALARYVYRKVVEQFGIELEAEVRFIGAKGEIDAQKVIK